MAAAGRHALVVACAAYDDPRLQKLSAPRGDADSFATMLGDPSLGGFTVQTVLDETAGTVAQAMEAFFKERRPSDLIVLYFSGHGVKDGDGRLYLAARNTSPDLLRSTGVPATLLHDLMEDTRARSQVLILDCCHSGAFGRGLVAKSTGRVGVGEVLAGQGRVVLAASDALQYAFEERGDVVGVGPAASSLFTRCLVDGVVSGAADLDRDGFVTTDELYDYACERMSAETSNQTPVMWAFGVQGDLVVARSRTSSECVLPPPIHLRHAEPSSSGWLAADGSPWWRAPRVLMALSALVLAGLAALIVPRVTGEETDADSDPVSAEPVRVNFQSPEAETPEGYLADFGQAYGERHEANQAEDLTYGWVAEQSRDPLDLVAMGRDRDRPGVEQRLDTLVHMEGWDAAARRIVPAVWELAVPQGRYAVTVSVGDATRNSANTVNVEGVPAIDSFRGTPEEDYQENRVVVPVTDGRLTVDSIGGENTKINYVEVVRLSDES